MNAGAGLLALAVALLVWSPGDRLALRRAHDVRGAAGKAREAGRNPPDDAAAGRRRWLLAGAAGLAVGLLLGGVLGVAAAVGVLMAGERLLRNRDGDLRPVRAALLRDLPAACDLLGVCLAAGLPVAGALTAVGTATGPPLGAHLIDVAALHRLGAGPRQAWAGVPSELAGLGRVLVRAGESGASVAPALRALAGDARAAARAETEAGVRRAGVWILAPLGLCFLPAFVCLGVAPLVLGIAGDVFG